MSFQNFKLSFKELQELRKNWNCTHIDVTPFQIHWNVYDFSSTFFKSKFVCSYVETIRSEFGETELFIKLLYNSSTKCLDLSLNVSPTQNKEHKVGLKCWVYILNKYKTKHMSKHVKLQEVNAELGIQLNEFIYFKRLEENDLIDDDTLSIGYEGCIADSGVNIFLKIPESHLSDDFANLLEDGKFSDAKITVSQREFKVHKAILASRSPIFEAMFSHDMEETKTGNIIISDIEEDVFEELLRFIYTGKTLNLEKVSDRLFLAADKYALERLKLMCEEDLSNRVSIENVGFFLKLAYNIKAKDLKVKVLDFIKRNKLDVIKSDDWKCLTQTQPDLVLDALQLLLINYD